ncbi:MAG: choline ABC transporter substrate-binding protein [Aliidongia sp.]
MLLLLGACLALAGAKAAEPESCRIVRMSDPGWSDIAATNGIAGVLLGALGYEQKIQLLSVPVTFQALTRNEIDVFLGNWLPAEQLQSAPLLRAATVERIRTNLPDGKFTLAVPSYVADAGVHSFADLAGHAGEFGSKIYGIDPGSPANSNIQRMLDDGDFALRGWTVVESSEQGMLGQVDRAIRRKQWIVFLAWEPHPMNTRYQLTYLAGGDAYFGPDFGNTTVDTLARKGFAAECPNLGRLFGQLAFQAKQEDALMSDIEARKAEPKAAAAEYLRANPMLLDPWLAGVATRDGKDGPAAVRKALEVPAGP